MEQQEVLTVHVFSVLSCSKTKKLTFGLMATKFCLVLRSTPSVPNQPDFTLRINTFLVGKILLLFHQKTALCYVFIFFHVKLKQSCLHQTQKRCVSEISFQSPFEAGNQLNVGVLSQSASSNHALLITKSALVIKKKCPLSQPISIQ